jgi:hypothetical protein
MSTTTSVSPWDLWILRGLDPCAEEVDVRVLIDARHRHDAWEGALFDRLLAGDVEPLLPGRRLLEARPELAAGLVLTMHLGPFQLVLEPFVAAGLRLHVLLNADAAGRLRPVAERLSDALRHRGTVVWHDAEDPSCGRRLLRALRDDEPILAFADGNQGRDGLAGTRRHGVAYQLPGREIRVRTGLARFACRTGCAVHPVSVRWSDAGRTVAWRWQPTQRWTRRDDPVAVTRGLFDWVFGEVTAAPSQWSYWPMLGEVAGCFVPLDDGDSVPQGLRDDYHRAFTIALDRAADTVVVELASGLEVWPGELLVDTSRDRFHAAEGLEPADLLLLGPEAPTLAVLVAARGRDWVASHVLRLCLLGLARLRGRVTVDAL